MPNVVKCCKYMTIQSVSQILIILMKANNGKVFPNIPKLHPFLGFRKKGRTILTLLRSLTIEIEFFLSPYISTLSEKEILGF